MSVTDVNGCTLEEVDQPPTPVDVHGYEIQVGQTVIITPPSHC